ncbi:MULTISPECIES: DUF2897 family protein [Idiomarinaceae]|uniref:DUF2897 family protein n=4 Tax=Pseudidiomarina TaxID=2800384 RepID=A0A368V3Y4_9GAMM|nr:MULTISPECIES: DUF2897 family protein [Idiomarinaceae]MDT7524719.1 DUF2897 family protein [Pseudidiomarina sp. GXY010]MRJ41410.1 DUF2897 family protein [Idiomarina sp. FeN1]NCU56885.1 DUF2897 family protein [Idiomarina sp. FenA--70]NCU59594.1 DUF2897 family protein [Idiomarina sp. FenBw--71]PWW14405.1 hypothetical protein DET45_10397 [Pseudidiomarina maritima]
MVWIALLIVFGIVIGNIMLLRHTAPMKMPPKVEHSQRHDDDWDSDKDA